MLSKPIIFMQFGSYVYGTNTPQSDQDYKGIFIPEPKKIIMNEVVDVYRESTKESTTAKNGPLDKDIEYFSLKKYFDLLLQAQLVALDMLFTPKRHWINNDGIWTEIVRLKEYWIHSDVVSYVGYCHKQAAKYGIKGSRIATLRSVINLMHIYRELHGDNVKLEEFWPEIEKFAIENEHCETTEFHAYTTAYNLLEVCGKTVQSHNSAKHAYELFTKVLDGYGNRALEAERNENVDWKAMCHALRICFQAQELLAEGHITFPRPEKKLLLSVRLGELPYTQVAEMVEAGMENLEVAKANSKLPQHPNYQLAQDIVYTEYRHAIASVDK